MSSSSSSSAPRSSIRRGIKRRRTGSKHPSGFISRESARVNNKLSLSKPVPAINDVVTIQQYVGETDIVSAVGAQFYSGAATGIFSPTIAFLDQVASFQALFDLYRIVRIDWEFRPFYGSSVWAPNTPDVPPLIYTMLDFDDNVILPSLAQARQYQNMRIHSASESFDVTCRPTCGYGVSVTTGTGAFTAPAEQVSPWLDTGNTGALHFGLKAAITASGAGNLARWHVSTRLTVEFQVIR